MASDLSPLLAQGAFADEAEAQRAVEATSAALGRALPTATARELARCAEPLTSPAAQGPHGQDLTASAVYAQVADDLGRPLARGMEQTQVVCRWLSPLLDAALWARVVRDLPPELSRLFEARRLEAAAFHGPGRGGALASGRTGSSRPLSEAAPGSEHPLHSARPRETQSESVSRRNPHGDTKLSSSEGLTQERERESLAEAHPRRN